MRIATIILTFMASLVMLSELRSQTAPPRPEGYVLVDDMWLPEPGPGDSLVAANLWTNGIVPYQFDANVTPQNELRARYAMSEIEAVAQIVFVPRSTLFPEQDFIHIQNHSSLNNSYVGMIGGGQVVNIHNWSFRYIIVHELLHALGVWHEQSRPDRDNFVVSVA